MIIWGYEYFDFLAKKYHSKTNLTTPSWDLSRIGDTYATIKPKSVSEWLKMLSSCYRILKPCYLMEFSIFTQ